MVIGDAESGEHSGGIASNLHPAAISFGSFEVVSRKCGREVLTKKVYRAVAIPVHIHSMNLGGSI